MYRAQIVDGKWSVVELVDEREVLVCVCGADLEPEGRHQRYAHTIALMLAAHYRTDPLPHD